MGRYDNLKKIAQLDAVKDHSEIVKIMVSYEFPWDFQRSYVEMVFVRFFAGTRMAGLVHGRGYAQAHPQRRYDDTSIMLFEMIKQGFATQLVQTALEDAQKLGYRVAILQAFAMGKNVAQRICFQECCPIEIYLWQPPEQ